MATLDIPTEIAAGGKKTKKEKKKKKKINFVSEAVVMKKSMKLDLFTPKSFHAFIPREAKYRSMANFNHLVDYDSLMEENDQFIIYCVAIFFITQRYNDAYRVCS